jgi:hypothetical protein
MKYLTLLAWGLAALSHPALLSFGPFIAMVVYVQPKDLFRPVSGAAPWTFGEYPTLFHQAHITFFLVWQYSVHDMIGSRASKCLGELTYASPTTL